MTKLRALKIALVLALVSLPLISFGLTTANAMVAWFGVGALVLGGLLPLAARFLFRDEREDHTGPEASRSGNSRGAGSR